MDSIIYTFSQRFKMSVYVYPFLATSIHVYHLRPFLNIDSKLLFTAFSHTSIQNVLLLFKTSILKLFQTLISKYCDTCLVLVLIGRETSLILCASLIVQISANKNQNHKRLLQESDGFQLWQVRHAIMLLWTGCWCLDWQSWMSPGILMKWFCCPFSLRNLLPNMNKKSKLTLGGNRDWSYAEL